MCFSFKDGEVKDMAANRGQTTKREGVGLQRAFFLTRFSVVFLFDLGAAFVRP